MPGPKAIVLEALRQRIAAFDPAPSLPVAATSPHGFLAVPPGYVHEVFAPTLMDIGAALGFTLGQARKYLTPQRPGILVLQLRGDLQETGVPYGPGLAGFGLDPDSVTFVQTGSIAELLWALEEALACRAVGAVVADFAHPHKALDFTASRRLSLRAADSGISVFLLSVMKDREASAAKYRWRIAPILSRAVPFDARAPGPPRWRVVLEKGQVRAGRPAGAEGETYLVDWTGNGFALADIGSKDRPRALPGAAVPGALSAVLGNRLSQTG